MKISHVNASENWELYRKKRIEIVSLYNKSSQFHVEETMINRNDLTHLDYLNAFYSKKIKGGLLVEKLVGSSHLALITFAAVEEKHQRKGVGRALIKAATQTLIKSQSLLVGVQVNQFDSHDFWIANGFTDFEYSNNNGGVLLKP